MALTYMTREELQSILAQLDQALHHHADKALYRAKADGRNCTRIFDPLINQKNPSDAHPII